MKRAILVIAVLISLIMSSCYARIKTYDDGFGTYKHYRPRYDRHNYQRDYNYHYKESYYHNNRHSRSFHTYQ